MACQSHMAYYRKKSNLKWIGGWHIETRKERAVLKLIHYLVEYVLPVRFGQGGEN